jgi:hypothetical protein
MVVECRQDSKLPTVQRKLALMLQAGVAQQFRAPVQQEQSDWIFIPVLANAGHARQGVMCVVG